jgi:cysteine synthase A
LVDDVVLVRDEDAFNSCRQLGERYGYSVGVSSGANFYAVRSVARVLNNKMTIVTVFPDSGQRYFDQI